MTLRPTLAGAALLASLALPSIATAADGYATADVNLRTGPGTAYPVATTIYSGAPVTIYGCIPDWAWCDVSFDGWRGWVSGTYLDIIYDAQPVYLPTYAPRVGLPVISFEFATYWDTHYRSRPWYRERDRWHNYWRERREDRREVREDRRERREDTAERREDRQERREDRTDRRDDRQDERQDNRQDRRQDAREERRDERQDTRQDNRQDAREERRDDRQDTRQDRRQEQRQDTRQERRQERRQDTRQERRQGQGQGENCRTRRNGEVVCE